MSKVIEAIYDGKVLIPLQPLDLEEGERVKISLRPSSTQRVGQEHRRRVLHEMWQHFNQNPPPGGPLSEESISRESIYEGRNEGGH